MRAERLAGRMRDFTTFMDEVAQLPPGCLANRRESGTYHYFCQSYNVLGFRQQPLRLLSEVCGVRLAPLPEANVCCGFGGSVSATRPEMCSHILNRKLEISMPPARPSSSPTIRAVSCICEAESTPPVDRYGSTTRQRLWRIACVGSHRNGGGYAE